MSGMQLSVNSERITIQNLAVSHLTSAVSHLTFKLSN